ncbi:hypothetical protein [Caldovatus aquaticus]|uniref:DUF4412 domain-containing protein n=1 Tax=Caldovatus aquaticus TaxID=2865671 RepID=A0ABS7F811_9PROT|nr:hypothetical protein [Caldovatus aquaticus]MBW8270955.1 hypothetical protein [Caldovatus aquaticus]
MRHRLAPRAATALLIAGLAPLPGAAQQAADRPPPAPTRDVAVTYRLGSAAAPAGAAASEMRIAWLAAERRMRLDLPGQGYLLVDQRNQRALMVMDGERVVMEIPFAQNTRRMGQLPPGARLTRGGDDRVAGIPCTVWTYQDRGHTGRSCVTADGVVLRVQGDEGPDDFLEAREVAYGPQDPASFHPPPDYTMLAMPAGMGAPMLPPAAFGGAAPAAPPPGTLPLAGAMPPGLLPGGLAPAGAAGTVSTGSSSSSATGGMPPAAAQPRRSR